MTSAHLHSDELGSIGEIKHNLDIQIRVTEIILTPRNILFNGTLFI